MGIDNQQLIQIYTLREKVRQLDTPKLLEERKKWISNLLIQNSDLWTFEMYKIDENIIKSKRDIPQFYNIFHNTRTKTKSETCAEIDKLSKEEAVKIICEFCLSLMKMGYHFAVFDCEGSRSPHIRIYDFEELESLDAYKREKAQAFFWRKVSPFLFHYLDSGMWADNHPYQIEFSIHFKYFTPFDLLFEYMPEVKKCKV